MKQDGLYIDDCWMLEMKKSALLHNYFDSIQKFKKDELPKKNNNNFVKTQSSIFQVLGKDLASERHLIPPQAALFKMCLEADLEL